LQIFLQLPLGQHTGNKNVNFQQVRALSSFRAFSEFSGSASDGRWVMY